MTERREKPVTDQLSEEIRINELIASRAYSAVAEILKTQGKDSAEKKKSKAEDALSRASSLGLLIGVINQKIDALEGRLRKKDYEIPQGYGLALYLVPKEEEGTPDTEQAQNEPQENIFDEALRLEKSDIGVALNTLPGNLNLNAFRSSFRVLPDDTKRLFLFTVEDIRDKSDQEMCEMLGIWTWEARYEFMGLLKEDLNEKLKMLETVVGEKRVATELGERLPVEIEITEGLGKGMKLDRRKYNIRIEDLELPMRAYNGLRRAGLHNVGAIFQSKRDLIVLRHVGERSVEHIKEALRRIGIQIPDTLK